MFENRLINDKINLIMKKVILIILIVIILTIALVVGVFVLNGNKYYKELIAEKSIETCVNEIRNNKNFTKKEDMTKQYIDHMGDRIRNDSYEFFEKRGSIYGTGKQDKD